MQAASVLSPEAVESALDEILDSPTFRTSRQSQVLLRYIVEHSLSGHEELLRERVIGATVFRRAPDYDTANDPVVRARVGDLRKRLAQYYQASQDHAIVISIPSGSYRATFGPLPSPTQYPPTPSPIRSVEPELQPDILEAVVTEPAQEAPSTKFWPWVALGIACLILLLSAALLLRRPGPKPVSANPSGPFLTFWAPFLAAGPSPVIYIGANYAYRLSTPFLQQYQASHHQEYKGQEFFVQLGPNESIPQKDLIPVHNLIGFGDVAASSRIGSTLTRLGAKYDLRYGQDLSITDMRSAPVVLVGGFSNQWGLELSRNLRFTLAKGDRILDRQQPTRAWPNLQGTPDDPPSDYVVVSRLPWSETGNCLLIIASIGTVGNQAAADFISDPASLNALLEKAPAGWDRKNMQIVLRASKVQDVPVSTTIEATYFW